MAGDSSGGSGMLFDNEELSMMMNRYLEPEINKIISTFVMINSSAMKSIYGHHFIKNIIEFIFYLSYAFYDLTTRFREFQEYFAFSTWR